MGLSTAVACWHIEYSNHSRVTDAISQLKLKQILFLFLSVYICVFFCCKFSNIKTKVLINM